MKRKEILKGIEGLEVKDREEFLTWLTARVAVEVASGRTRPAMIIGAQVHAHIGKSLSEVRSFAYQHGVLEGQPAHHAGVAVAGAYRFAESLERIYGTVLKGLGAPELDSVRVDQEGRSSS